MEYPKYSLKSVVVGMFFKNFVIVALLGLFTACGTLDTFPPPALDYTARWAILPFANHTETPQAGARATAIVEAILRARGVNDLTRAPLEFGVETLIEPQDAQMLEKTLAWARNAGMRYALTGSVTEWRYKVGVDGEPAVGLTLQLYDVANARVVWTASGARSGWSREALSAVAHKLARELMQPLAKSR